MPANTELMPVVREVLTNHRVKFEEKDEGRLINFRVKTDNACLEAAVRTNEETAMIKLFLRCGVVIPPGSQVAVTILLNRLNNDTFFSSFVLDPEDGWVFLKVGLEVEDSTLSYAMVDNMLRGAISLYESCFPQVMAVAFGGMSPEDALNISPHRTTAGEE
jgi:hypothetical protein